MATYVIYANIHADGFYGLRSRSVGSWSTAREGGTITQDSGGSFARLGVSYNSPNNWWDAYQMFLSFDTSAINGETVVSSSLFLDKGVFSGETEFNVRARADNTWSYPVSSGDFVAGSALSSYTLLGTELSTTFSTHSSGEMVLDSSAINTSGTTKLLLTGEEQESSATPAGTERTIFDEPGSADEPYLVIQTVKNPPSTIMGVHDAAVQLSDGSTVYLEGDGASVPTVSAKHVNTAGTISTWWADVGYSYWDYNAGEAIAPPGLQSMALAVDGQDNVYIFYYMTDTAIGYRVFDSSGISLVYDYLVGGTNLETGSSGGQPPTINNMAAVYCDAGSGTNALGRMLIVVSDAGETWTGGSIGYKYFLFDVNTLLTDVTTGSELESGENPSWLVPSSDYRNISGTGLSLATDVFGGTRVESISWSSDVSDPANLSFVTQASNFLVGATISDVSTETLPDFDGLRAKVVGAGSDRFVGAWNSNLGVYLKRLGSAGTQIIASSGDVEDFETDPLSVSITGTWERTSSEAYEGTWSYKAGTITHDQQTDAVLTLPAETDAIKFRYKVSSETGWDFFEVIVGGSAVFSDSGEVDWTLSPVIDVSSVSEVTFRYRKDANTSAGSDTAWIDNLEFIQNATDFNFDIVYDEIDGVTWVYYWNSGDNTKLMRTPYKFMLNELGEAREVSTFAGAGTRDFIRTAKALRDPQYTEVHFNITDTGYTFDRYADEILPAFEPSTLLGIHDASVQLSDGSTAYLESNGIYNGIGRTAGPYIELKHVSPTGTVTAIGYIYHGQAEIYPKSQGLQFATLVTDASDNIYFIGTTDSNSTDGLQIRKYVDAGGYTLDSSVTYMPGDTIDNVAATFFDAGAGLAGEGRILITGFKQSGESFYQVIECDDLSMSIGDITPWSIEALVLEDSYYLWDGTLNPECAKFSPDGLRAYIPGDNSKIVQYSLGTAWDIASGSLEFFLDMSSQETNLKGLAFNDTGTKLYITGLTSDAVHQYSLSVAWDLSSTVTHEATYDVSAQDASPASVFFSSSGDKMFIGGTSNKSVYSYTLSTPWELSSNVAYESSYYIGNEEDSLGEAVFNDTGTKMYVVGSSSNAVYQYSLSVAWDITTASYPRNSYNVSSQTSAASDVVLNDTGTKMYIIGYSSDAVHQYSLSTAWDISSTVTYEASYGVSAQESSPVGLAFNDTGTKIYVIGYSSDAVQQYSLSVAWDISSTVTHEASYSVSTQETTPRGLTFNDTGMKLYVVGSSSDSVHQYSLSTAWDIGSTVTYETSYGVSAQETGPSGIVFNNDGTKLYISGSSDIVNQYSLSTAWDLASTVTHEAMYNVSDQGATDGIAFNNVGTRMYLTGISDEVHQYDLSVAWEISYKPSFEASYSVAVQETNPQGIVFNDTGTKLYIAGTDSGAVYQYSLSVAWDIGSTVTYESSCDVSAQTLAVYGLAFNDTGTKFYVSSAGASNVYQYSLSTAWDLSSTVTYEATYDVSAQETSPYGIEFNDIGTKLYVIGTASDSINQYSLSVAWDLSSTVTHEASYGVSDQETFAVGFAFGDTGMKLYVTGYNSDAVHQYSLSTAWDISSTVTHEASYGVSDQETKASDIVLNNTGDKLYVIGVDSDAVHQYSLPVAWKLYDESITTFTNDAYYVRTQDFNTYGVSLSADGSMMFVSGQAYDRIFRYQLGTNWDVTSATYTDGDYLDVTPREETPAGLVFNDAGTKFYITGNGSGSVHQYSLSTAWDIGSTVTYESSYDVSAQDSNPYGLVFNDAGTKLYIVGTGSDSVHQYSLSVAWDLSSTVTYEATYDVSAQESLPTGLAFNDTGTKLYVIGYSSDSIQQYSLSTAWDLASTVTHEASYEVSAQDSSPRELTFNDNGTELYIVGSVSDAVHQYSLSTAWDISSTVVHEASYEVSAQETAPYGFTFNDTGNKLYIVGIGSDSINQYDLHVFIAGESPIWTTPSSNYINTSGTALDVATDEFGGGGLSAIAWSDNGSTPVLRTSKFSIGTNVVVDSITDEADAYDTSGVRAKILGTGSVAVSGAWDMSQDDQQTYSYESSLDLLPETSEWTPEAVAFNSDGTAMFVVGTSYLNVFRYNLSTPWDISTASYSGDFFDVWNTGTPVGIPTGLTFKPDGTEMYMVGVENDRAVRYTLSVAWDVTTASVSDSLDVSTQDLWPQGIAISDDGAYMFIAGDGTDTIYRYSLPTPWTFGGTPTNDQSFSLAGVGGHARDLEFSPDGLHLYVLDTDGEKMNHFSLATAWDISAGVTLADSFPLTIHQSSQDGLAFSQDGTSFYIADHSDSTVTQYSLRSSVPIHIGIWNHDSGVLFKKLGAANTQEVFGVTYFDAVYDEREGAVWAYYFSANDLMRIPYYIADNTLGTAETVTTDATATTKNYVRTPRELRNPAYVEVHYNRTSA